MDAVTAVCALSDDHVMNVGINCYSLTVEVAGGDRIFQRRCPVLIAIIRRQI
jgi:hypothetical protein